VDITYLGGSSFLLRGRDAAIITDPQSGGESSRRGAIDIATMSCAEDAAADGVESSDGDDDVGRLVTRPGEYEISGVLIRGVRHAHPPSAHRAVSYLFTIDGVNICHLGHLSQALTGAEVGELDGADVVLIPVSGEGTLSPTVASEILVALSPRLVIPMSYPAALPGQQMELGAATGEARAAGDLEPFLREMGATQVEPQPRISVTPNNMPAEREVVLLQVR
jgi:L-ascorbate metabolism protein UlaG (beta-lactamase superfamily)